MTIHSNGIDPRARCGTVVTASLSAGRERKLTTDDWDQVTCKRCLGSFVNANGSKGRPASVTESPMDIVNRTSKLWIGATVIGYTGGGDQMDVQIRLTDGTVMRVAGLVKPDPWHSK
jgi:hypothetical protein